MRAIDTNVLVHAENRASPWQRRAAALLRELAGGGEPWAIPWPCIYEFLRVTTHARVFHPPLALETALHDVRFLLAAPTVMTLAETPLHGEFLERVLAQSGATGNLVHDAHIAALCLEHGVSELLSSDRDFTRFAGLRVTNPFVPER